MPMTKPVTKSITKPTTQTTTKAKKSAIRGTTKNLPLAWQTDINLAVFHKFGRDGRGPKAPVRVAEGTAHDVYYVTVDGKVLESSKTADLHRALITSRVENARGNGQRKIQVRRESDGAVLATSSLLNLQKIGKEQE